MAEMRQAGAVRPALVTAEISYWLPDHPSLLQLFVWQAEDWVPDYPALHRFLDHWRREVEATLHMVRVAHAGRAGTDARWRAMEDWTSLS